MESVTLPDKRRVDRVYTEVRQRIVEGRYRPGMFLSESVLGRLHVASRTPVREALARLAQDGYVMHVPGRGQFVASVTADIIRDLFELRRVLEGSAAAFAARRHDRAQLDVMKRAAEEPPAGHAVGGLPDRAFEFHLAVGAATHNQSLLRQVEDCLRQIYRCLAFRVSVVQLRVSDHDDHCAIVRAIERRDPDEAREQMQGHIDRTFEAALPMA
jgi:DNA-binding GntR family transcriptional regulator